MPNYVVNCHRCGVWIRDTTSPPNREYCEDCHGVFKESARQQEHISREADKELERIWKRHTLD